MTKLIVLSSRVKELEAKLEVIMRSKQAAETTTSEKVSHLEKALEEVSVDKSYKVLGWLSTYSIYLLLSMELCE